MLHSIPQLNLFLLFSFIFHLGKLLGFKEVNIKDAGTTAKNSMSLNRAPGPPDEVTTGSSTNYPFWPGGFDFPDLRANFDISDVARQCIEEIEDPSQHLTCPPGFDHGVIFLQEENNTTSTGPFEKDIINLASLITSSKLIVDDLGIWKKGNNLRKKMDDTRPKQRGS